MNPDRSVQREEDIGPACGRKHKVRIFPPDSEDFAGVPCTTPAPNRGFRGICAQSNPPPDRQFFVAANVIFITIDPSTRKCPSRNDLDWRPASILPKKEAWARALARARKSGHQKRLQPVVRLSKRPV
jgi:hypothetical protein